MCFQGSAGSSLSKALLRLPESVNKRTNKQTNWAGPLAESNELGRVAAPLTGLRFGHTISVFHAMWTSCNLDSCNEQHSEPLMFALLVSGQCDPQPAHSWQHCQALSS